MVNETHPTLPSFGDYLLAYQKLLREFQDKPVKTPGRMNLLGWDLEYVSGAALATFTDTIFIRRINDFLPDNDYPHILDCGANIGCTVLNYKRQFPNARITAFEPDPQFAPILRRNLANNNASDVEVVEAAVWTQDGEISWICEGVDGSRIVEDGSTSNMITVPTIDLVKYLQVSVDLLKLDIEGAEYAVVDHISHNLEKVKNIIVECHIQQSNLKDFGRLLGTLKRPVSGSVSTPLAHGAI